MKTTTVISTPTRFGGAVACARAGGMKRYGDWHASWFGGFGLRFAQVTVQLDPRENAHLPGEDDA